MKRDCPTIQELLAFDAVVRHHGLTQAADALCITVSAVSKQLAGIERFVGTPLLQRQGRGVALTPAGRAYWQKVAPSLRAIEMATYELRSSLSGNGVLTLASVPTFLTKWLIPRLPGMRREHPGITLSFTRHLDASESIPPGVDAAIRYGDGDWPGIVAEYVAGREFVAVSAPTLASSAGRITQAQHLRGHTLLHHAEAPAAWRLWAIHHGAGDLPVLAGPRFAQYSALIQAAVSGLGIGLVPRILVEDELASGALHITCGAAVNLAHGHYLCYHHDRLDVPVFAAFREWILAAGTAGSSRWS